RWRALSSWCRGECGRLGGRRRRRWSSGSGPTTPRASSRAGRITSAGDSGAYVKETRAALRTLAVSRLGDAVEVALPDDEVHAARLDHGVFHAEARRVLRHRVPAQVGVLDVCLGVQAEELEPIVGHPEQLSPANALHAEPALLPNEPAAIAGHVDALGAGIGDEAFEPVPVAHEAIPGVPAHPGRVQRRGRADVVESHADERAELFEDLPV